MGPRASAFEALGADVFEAARALLARTATLRIKETARLLLLVLAVLVLLILAAFPFSAAFTALAAPASTTAAAAAATPALGIPDALGDFLLDEVVDLAFGKRGRDGVWNGSGRLHVVCHLDVHELDRHLNRLAELLSHADIFHPFAPDRHVGLLGLLKWDLKIGLRMNDMLSNVAPINVKLVGRYP